MPDSTKALPEAMWYPFQLDPWEQTSVKFEAKYDYKYFFQENS